MLQLYITGRGARLADGRARLLRPPTGHRTRRRGWAECPLHGDYPRDPGASVSPPDRRHRSEEHTSELQSPDHLVCRRLLEKKNNPPRRTEARRRPMGQVSPAPPVRQQLHWGRFTLRYAASVRVLAPHEQGIAVDHTVQTDV